MSVTVKAGKAKAVLDEVRVAEDERTKFLEGLACSAEENRKANRHAAEWKDLHKLLRFGGRKAKRMVALPLRLTDDGDTAKEKN